jgi:hypothetical protein
MRVLALFASAFLLVHAALAQCDAPTHHRRIGEGVEVMQSAGTLAFLGHPSLVEIYDVADPNLPIPVGSISFPGTMTTAIEPRGTLLYIASYDDFDFTATLTVADITTPSSPVILASITWADRIVDLAASTDRLAVLDFAGRIRILDTTNPAQPITGATISSENFDDLELRLNVLYATFRDTSFSPPRSRLRCYAIGNISSPNILSTTDLGVADMSPPKLDRLGLTLAATASTRLSIFDLTVPGTPALLSTSTVHRAQSSPRLSEYAGTTLCHVFAEGFPAAVWDVTNPASPVRRAFYGTMIRTVAPVANAALAFDRDVLASVSFATPGQPDTLWTIDYGLPAEAGFVVASGSHLIFVNDRDPLTSVSTIIDVSDRDRPAFRGAIVHTGQTWDVEADGNLLAIADPISGDDRFRVTLYDLVDPANPTLLSNSLEVENSSQFANVSVFLDGRVGVIQLAREWYVVDLSNPAQPRVTARIPTASLYSAELDDGLYIQLRTDGPDRFEVYDLTDPYNPRLAATINEPDADDFAYDARTLLVERSTDVTAVYDISNPAAATLSAEIPRPSSFNQVNQVLVAGSIATLVSSDRYAFFTLAQANNPVALGEVLVDDSPTSAWLIGRTLWTRDFLTSVSAFDLGQLPAVTQHPLSRAVCPGGSFTLTANAQSDSPMTYRWRYNGSFLENGTLPGGTIVSGAFTRTLSVSNFNPADAGVFSLRFNNSCGSVLSRNAVILPGETPRFLDQPAAVLSCPLASVSFSGSTNNLPVAVLRWQAEVPANSGTYVDLADTSNAIFSISGAQTTSLTIAPLPGQRLPTVLQTRYRLKSTNACGVSTSLPAMLTLCSADVNCDGFLDFFDYDDFVAAFESGSPPEVADFNGDGFADFFDLDDFVASFELGC